jgi:membrane-associated protein
MDVTELLAWIARYDQWVYGLLLVYALAKTGPLPMVAGFVAAQGVLRVELVLVVVMVGSLAGAQLRFGLGRFLSPWVCQRLPRVAPWIALASAGVERYNAPVLMLYRFVKGAFSLVGLGAGASLLAWPRHVLWDVTGAALWASAMIGLGYGLGSIGAQLDPRWAAYLGLGLLVGSILTLSLLSHQIKSRLLPLAERILAQRSGRMHGEAPHNPSSRSGTFA